VGRRRTQSPPILANLKLDRPAQDAAISNRDGPDGEATQAGQRQLGTILMRERGERDREQNYHDPDAEPWTVLALIVLLALVCLIVIARFALALIAG